MTPSSRREEFERLVDDYATAYMRYLCAAPADLPRHSTSPPPTKERLLNFVALLKDGPPPRTFPLVCHLCEVTVESLGDLEYHGLGDCVDLCEPC